MKQSMSDRRDNSAEALWWKSVGHVEGAGRNQ